MVSIIDDNLVFSSLLKSIIITMTSPMGIDHDAAIHRLVRRFIIGLGVSRTFLFLPAITLILAELVNKVVAAITSLKLIIKAKYAHRYFLPDLRSDSGPLRVSPECILKSAGHLPSRLPSVPGNRLGLLDGIIDANHLMIISG